MLKSISSGLNVCCHGCWSAALAVYAKVCYCAGVCLLPAALGVDFCCDLAVQSIPAAATVRVNRARRGLAIILTVTTCSVCAVVLVGPLSAGVCVCRHRMWMSNSATLVDQPLESLALFDLSAIMASCLVVLWGAGLEIVVRLLRLIAHHYVVSACCVLAWRCWCCLHH